MLNYESIIYLHKIQELIVCQKSCQTDLRNLVIMQLDIKFGNYIVKFSTVERLDRTINVDLARFLYL